MKIKMTKMAQRSHLQDFYSGSQAKDMFHFFPRRRRILKTIEIPVRHMRSYDQFKEVLKEAFLLGQEFSNVESVFKVTRQHKCSGGTAVATVLLFSFGSVLFL